MCNCKSVSWPFHTGKVVRTAATVPATEVCFVICMMWVGRIPGGTPCAAAIKAVLSRAKPSCRHAVLTGSFTIFSLSRGVAVLIVREAEAEAEDMILEM